MQDAVRFNLEGVSDAKMSDAIIQRLLNDAYRHVAQPKVFTHPELEGKVGIALVADTVRYDINPAALAGYVLTPTTMTRVLAVRSVRHLQSTTYPPGNRVSVREVRRRDQQRIDDRSHTQGPPRWFSTRGHFVNIDKYPTSTEAGQYLELNVYFFGAELVADDSVTVLQDEWDRVIVQIATGYGWADLERHDRATLRFGHAFRMVRDLGGDVIEEQDFSNQVEPRHADSMPPG